MEPTPPFRGVVTEKADKQKLKVRWTVSHRIEVALAVLVFILGVLCVSIALHQAVTLWEGTDRWEGVPSCPPVERPSDGA